MKIAWVALSMALGLFACGEERGGKAEGTASQGVAATAANEAPTTDKERGPAAKKAAASDNPCEILTAAVVRKHFKLADDLEINQRLSSPGGHAHCSYNWSTLTPEQEAQRSKELAEAIIARAKKRAESKSKDKANVAQGIADMAMSRSSGRGSAHLTMTKEMASDEAAVGALRSVRSYLEKRAKGKVGEHEVDFTSATTDVAGVGSAAHYSAKQRQLSLAYGKRLYHLGATPHDDGDSLQLATAIARELFP